MHCGSADDDAGKEQKDGKSPVRGGESMIDIAILGFGTVGSGVAEVIDRNQREIRRDVPEGIHVKYILDLRDFPDSPYSDRVVHDIDTILNDPEIRVICETMGGKEPAFTFSKRALERGISVCTSNKELVDALGGVLAVTAREHDCSYLFEASVGGGIPILRPLRTSFSQEFVTSIIGILNGTTNYILTKMEKEGLAFDTALRQAQDNGYAERNPEADIEGYDPCRKIAILASLVTGGNVKYEQVPCEGITKIDTDDFVYAAQLHSAIKLLGVCRHDPETGKVYVRTAPYMIPVDHPLYGVSDVYNGILVHGNMVGDLMFYGSGAGKLPTASAVVSDVVECARSVGSNIDIGLTNQDADLLDPMEWEDRYFVRIGKEDLVKATGLFGNEIQIVVNEALPSEFAFVTSKIKEADFRAKAEQLSTLKKSLRVL